MSKELEALKRIETTFSMNKQGKESVYRDYTNSIYPYYEDFDLVLNGLKRLDLIIEKRVDIWLIESCFTAKQYNSKINEIDDTDIFNLTEEEFELLKGSVTH